MRLSLKQLEEGVLPVRFPIQFDSLSTLLPNTQNMRQAARLLSLNGQVAVYDRDSSATQRSIESLLGCSKVLGGESIIVSNLVAIALDGMALNVLKSALQHDVLDEADLKRILPRLLEKTTIGPEWSRAMAGERAMVLPIFDDPSKAFPNGRSRPALPGRSPDALYYLDHMDGVLSISPENLGEFMLGLQAQEAELERRTSEGFLAQFDSMVTGMVMPANAAVGNAFVRQATQHRLAALSVGVRLYEKRHGKLPDSLGALAEFNLDATQLMPIGKSPFGYTVDEQGAKLWGFESNQVQSTPEEPPPVNAENPNAAMNRLWIWELPAASNGEP